MIQLLLIGTTHLNIPNNGDVLMPETSDILSPTRQQELDAFVTAMFLFRTDRHLSRSREN
ncbi:hypothetical protein [Exiguobacterium sp. s150]|uniref:hypothetical protein n=1 Tax=Exiguobacterium sp. s150 TaxID=2751221 RepID=UPI001BE5262B|nr:hypothetical protein [Exiguobacterium sp. s150]